LQLFSCEEESGLWDFKFAELANSEPNKEIWQKPPMKKKMPMPSLPIQMPLLKFFSKN
jgi:hypothetical protein